MASLTSHSAISIWHSVASALDVAASTASTKAGILLVLKILYDEGELPQAKRLLIYLEGVPKDPLPNETIARLTADWKKSLNLASESFRIDYGELNMKILLYTKLVSHDVSSSCTICSNMTNSRSVYKFQIREDPNKHSHYYASKLDDHNIRFTMTARKNRKGLEEGWIDAVRYFVHRSDRLLGQWERKEKVC
jgi:hypothetical protein